MLSRPRVLVAFKNACLEQDARMREYVSDLHEGSRMPVILSELSFDSLDHVCVVQCLEESLKMEIPTSITSVWFTTDVTLSKVIDDVLEGVYQ